MSRAFSQLYKKFRFTGLSVILRRTGKTCFPFLVSIVPAFAMRSECADLAGMGQGQHIYRFPLNGYWRPIPIAVQITVFL